MVFEEIYSLETIKKHWIFEFILGLTASVIGIGCAVLIFPEDPALIGVAVTALILLPTLKNLMEKEREGKELEEYKKKTKLPHKTAKKGLHESITHHLLRGEIPHFLRNYLVVIRIYALLFLGIFLGFSVMTLLLPTLATNYLFETQLTVITGQASLLDLGIFLSLIQNNLMVLGLIFIFSLIIGDVGIFIISWNASVWGTVFGTLAKTAADNIAGGLGIVFFFFLIIFFSVLAHMLLEAIAYFTGAISGSVLSKSIIREKFKWMEFRQAFISAVIILTIAVTIMIIGGYVEQYVLKNLDVYRSIIELSFGI